MAAATGDRTEPTGELAAGRLPHADTNIFESRDELPGDGKRANKTRALLVAGGAGMMLLIILGVVIVAALGQSGQPATTAPSADAQAQQKILADNERKSRLSLTDRTLNQMDVLADPAAQTQEMTPEAIAQQAAEAQHTRAEGNLMIRGILQQAAAQQDAALTAAPPPPRPADETDNRSLYRGVDSRGANTKAAAEQRDKDYARERQTMFCYSRTMKQADLYDEPPADPGPAERRPDRAEPNAAEPAARLGPLNERPGGHDTPRLAGARVSRVDYGDRPAVRLYEGDFIDTVLQNRIVADKEPSPVVCYVTKDHFDPAGKWVVFPTGTRLIGLSQAVDYMGASRLFVKFNRMVLPNGSLVYFPESKKAALALDQTGAHGIVSKVNRHWMLQFGTAVFVGVLEGLGAAAQQHTDPYSGRAYVIEDTTDNFEKILNTIMQRYTNIVPTITVDAGKKVKVYLADDVEISPYSRIDERSYAR